MMDKKKRVARALRASRERSAFGVASWTAELVLAGIAAAAMCFFVGSGIALGENGDHAKAAPRLTADLTGSVPAHDGQTLQLTTDVGNVIIHTQNSGKIDYRVHVETDASQKDAKNLLSRFHMEKVVTRDAVRLRGAAGSQHPGGRLWVTLDLNIPQEMNVDATTGGGNIQMEDLRGSANLTTAGGNLVTGNIFGPAHLQTDGGHISVKNVSGELVAETGGGHITAGEVGGSALLHTNGGHIRVTSVGGVARLETGGGNITVEHAQSELVAETEGGQIEVGEAQGLVRAKTGGGGIRVVHLTGPTNLQTGNGSIYLTRVDSSVKAWTQAGGITAWIAKPMNARSTCDLQSKEGDIVVYLPPELPATIDAEIQMGERHRLIVDPALPIKVNYGDSGGGLQIVRAEGALNGGGEIFRLRTVAGNIHLIAIDSTKQMDIYRQQMEELQQKLQLQLKQWEQFQTDQDASPAN
jgi:DUF4097 and DUF4098 domain-containing protein YvlB